MSFEASTCTGIAYDGTQGWYNISEPPHVDKLEFREEATIFLGISLEPEIKIIIDLFILFTDKTI